MEAKREKRRRYVSIEQGRAYMGIGREKFKKLRDMGVIKTHYVPPFQVMKVDLDEIDEFMAAHVMYAPEGARGPKHAW